MPRMPEGTITPGEAAQKLGLHTSTLYRLILHGKIPARRVVGCRYALRVEDVDRFADGEAVVPVPRVPWKRGGTG